MTNWKITGIIATIVIILSIPAYLVKQKYLPQPVEPQAKRMLSPAFATHAEVGSAKAASGETLAPLHLLTSPAALFRTILCKSESLFVWSTRCRVLSICKHNSSCSVSSRSPRSPLCSGRQGAEQPRDPLRCVRPVGRPSRQEVGAGCWRCALGAAASGAADGVGRQPYRRRSRRRHQVRLPHLAHTEPGKSTNPRCWKSERTELSANQS